LNKTIHANKTILILVFSFITNLLSCQQSDPDTTQKSKYFAGIYISPDLNFYKSRSLEKKKEINKVNFGYTIGLISELSLSKRFSLTFGLNYSLKIYKPNLRFFGVYTENDELIKYPLLIKQNLNLLEIPLNLRFKIQNDNSQLIPYIFAGASTFFQIFSINTYLYDNDTKEIEIKDNKFEMLDMLPELGLGIEYFISNNVKINIQPTLRFNGLFGLYTPVKTDINKLAFIICLLYYL